jgi:hypothetical protein
MNSSEPASTDIRQLHAIVDAEVTSEALSEDPNAAVVDPDLQAYKARLSNLHDAVVAMEDYEAGLGGDPS